MILMYVIVLVVLLAVAAFVSWAFLPARYLPGNRARYLRLRLRLRLHLGRGFATVFGLWLQWGRLAALRRSRGIRRSLPLWQRLLDPHAHSVFLGRAHYQHGLRVPAGTWILGPQADTSSPRPPRQTAGLTSSSRRSTAMAAWTGPRSPGCCNHGDSRTDPNPARSRIETSAVWHAGSRGRPRETVTPDCSGPPTAPSRLTQLPTLACWPTPPDRPSWLNRRLRAPWTRHARRVRPTRFRLITMPRR
jgi:hypothetical protein